MRAFLSVIIFLFMSAPAFAHQPYVVKHSVITDPDGRPLITERLQGDGVFTADPKSFQIRNAAGAVLGYSPAGTHVGVFCPSVEFCWAFPYGQLLPFAKGWRLDIKSVDWRQMPEPPDASVIHKGAEEDFKKYLDNPHVKYAHGYGFNDPQFRDGFYNFTDSLLSVVASPFIILWDQILFVTIIAVLSLLTFFLSRLVFVDLPKRDVPFRIALSVLGFVALTVVFGVMVVSAFVMAVTMSAQLVYLLGGSILGGIFPRLVSRRRERRR